MLIIPAIDLLGGEVVRLHQGDYATATVYRSDAVSVAREFEKAGAKRIHIVDLDAAHGGQRNNRKKLRKIRKAFSGIIEIGGGIRDESDIEELMDIGIDKFVVGTMLVKNYRKVEGWIQHFGKLFLAGIDALEGKVKISGWEKATDMEDVALVDRAKTIGISSIIYTNISRDGTMEGPDVDSTLKIANASAVPVIHSGGIRTTEDIAAVASQNNNKIKAVIVGKALYEGTIDLNQVIEQYQTDESGGSDW
jgi:phosphoribosylformimino-5-aminoimidazole carboxamide ribotide isomerase